MISKKEIKEFKQKLASLKEKQEKKDKNLQALEKKTKSTPLRYAHLGVEFATSFIICLFVGNWLDQKWQTAPWLMLLGLTLGFALGMYRLIYVAKELGKESDS